MVVLQAAIGMGLFIMTIFGILIFIALPASTILIYLKKKVSRKKTGDNSGFRQNMMLFIQSFLTSLGLVLAIAIVIVFVLYLTVDLSIS